MIIDFSKITVYEILALTLSLIAILVPFIKWAWHSWIIKANLNFIPNEKMFIFFNRSGAYVRIDGAYEALNKSITIRRSKVRIIREDNCEFNLDWSTFISPVWQNFSGSIASSNEYAHPFRLEANSLMCAFVEYADPFNKGNILWQQIENKLKPDALGLRTRYESYEEALKVFETFPEFTKAYQNLQDIFFWQAGKYTLTIENQYGTQNAIFKYHFTLHQSDIDKLKCNIEKLLSSILSEKYGISLCYENLEVELKKE